MLHLKWPQRPWGGGLHRSKEVFVHGHRSIIQSFAAAAVVLGVRHRHASPCTGASTRKRCRGGSGEAWRGRGTGAPGADRGTHDTEPTGRHFDEVGTAASEAARLPGNSACKSGRGLGMCAPERNAPGVALTSQYRSERHVAVCMYCEDTGVNSLFSKGRGETSRNGSSAAGGGDGSACRVAGSGGQGDEEEARGCRPGPWALGLCRGGGWWTPWPGSRRAACEASSCLGLGRRRRACAGAGCAVAGCAAAIDAEAARAGPGEYSC